MLMAVRVDMLETGDAVAETATVRALPAALPASSLLLGGLLLLIGP